ncbi:MAG: hypothetical protein QOF36_1535, partial [Microbacteriaceae bacterium]|nr:hypothetical protein [Microbacteriaceae bacterium]
MSETESPAKTVAAPARVPSMRARLGAEIVGTF